VPDPTKPILPARRGIVGEPLVWLTAMGLTICLLLVVSLFGIVIANGMSVFWPHAIGEYTITRASGTVDRVYAIEVKQQTKRAPGAQGIEEIQLFTANKDLTGNPFRYVEVEALTRTDPPDLWRIERLEHGPAIGRMVALRGPGTAEIAATDPTFPAELSKAIAEADDHRNRIRHIERTLIGASSHEIKELELERKRLTERGGASARVAEVDARIAALNAEFTGQHDPERKRLRAELGLRSLVIVQADGREMVMPMGNVLHAERPNQMGVFAKVGRFIANFAAFLWDEPREANTEGGIFPAIIGTVSMTLLMSVAVVPFGVVAAIYLREYAKQGPFVRFVRISVNNLAGVPSIVFGVFGLGFFVYLVGGNIDALFFPGRPDPVFGTGTLLWASLTLALMTVPVVIVATEESIAAVPRGMKEGSLACGASKWQTIQRIVLPASVPGILTGLILAMARGAGEVAPLMLVGVVKLAPELPLGGEWPFVHLDYKFMHLGFHIYDVGFQSPDSEAAKPMVFATTFVLILLVLILNLSAILIRERLRKKYATGAF
jgi:phosphate transport system permease protein